MHLIASLRSKVPDWLWAGLVSGVAAAVGSFSLLSLGWLTDVAEWADSAGATEFPDLSVLGYGAVSATVGIGAAVLNALYRWAQSKTALVPGDGPTYPKD